MFKKTLWLSAAVFRLLSGRSFAVAGLVSITTDPDNASNKVLQFTEDGAIGGAHVALWNPSTGIALSANTWYNVQVVVDHAANTLHAGIC